jgi:hypothetical protein
MRIATIHGRVALIDGAGSGAVDVEMASGGRFGPEPASVYERWTEFAAWAGSAPLPPPEALEPASLGSPSPNPRQVFRCRTQPQRLLRYSTGCRDGPYSAAVVRPR